MILSTLNNDDRYAGLHTLFPQAFDFLKSGIASLPDGKIEINGDDLFAIMSRPGTTAASELKPESHKKYLDIHYIIEGMELFGWKSINDVKNPEGTFDEEKDYILYNDQDYKELLLKKGDFMIVYPEDVHMPGIKTEQLHKVVLKIKL
jgi:YhcH/YjgK/YiaL family protein